MAGQQAVLEQIFAWLPAGARVRLSADHFDPSAGLFAWLTAHGWNDRLRLKSNVLADTGQGDETTTGALAHGVTERDLTGVRLFAKGVMTNLGILHEAGHPESWIMALDATPTRATVLDDAARWVYRSLVSWLTRGMRRLKRCLQNDLPLSAFHGPWVTDR